MKNNAYLICNKNEYNYILISNMVLLVNDINQDEIKNVSFDKNNKRVNIDSYYIDIDDEHLDVVEYCVKQENITLSVLSTKGEILSIHQIH